MSAEKIERYERSRTEITGLLDGLDDAIAAMASTAAVLQSNLPWVSWVGFYRVVAPKLLRIGPYQGPVGCLEISFGQGVCGAAALTLKTQIVEDVHAFEGHIACDPTSRSEIVVPIIDENGSLLSVLDLDSRQTAAFDDVDQRYLEQITSSLASALG